MSGTSEKKIKCPTCGKPTLFSPQNASRPFCSERCKLIDLGAWAEEKYAIPVAPAVDIDAESESGDDEGSDESGLDDDGVMVLEPRKLQRSRNIH